LNDGNNSVAIAISKTQIDKLGDRLKEGNITEADLRLLDEYRLSFTDAYEFVVGRIGQEVNLKPTGRPAKSTSSISDKLCRESIRLTQIQDIAGCRLVLADVPSQNQTLASLQALFDKTTIVDRREKPSHGYRAVHLVVKHTDKLVEIQIRSALQHLWAELSEKLSDTVDPALKYGGGDPSWLEVLARSSALVAQQEWSESELIDLEARLSRLLKEGKLTEKKQKRIVETQEQVNLIQKTAEALRRGIFDIFRHFLNEIEED
jgi:predicted transcriptional regulator